MRYAGLACVGCGEPGALVLQGDVIGAPAPVSLCSSCFNTFDRLTKLGYEGLAKFILLRIE